MRDLLTSGSSPGRRQGGPTIALLLLCVCLSMGRANGLSGTDHELRGAAKAGDLEVRRQIRVALLAAAA